MIIEFIDEQTRSMIVYERHCGHGELLLKSKEDKGEKFYPREKTCQLNDNTMIEI